MKTCNDNAFNKREGKNRFNLESINDTKAYFSL